MIKLHFSFIRRRNWKANHTYFKRASIQYQHLLILRPSLRKNRQPYNHIYRLIDNVLAKAAGSSSLKSQLKVLEARWKYVHKQPLLPYTMDFNALDSAIEALSWQVKENCPGMKSQETKLSKKLLEKLVGNCEEKQLTFLMNLAKGINGKTYILEALRTLPIARSYDLLTKNERRA